MAIKYSNVFIKNTFNLNSKILFEALNMNNQIIILEKTLKALSKKQPVDIYQIERFKKQLIILKMRA